MHVNARKMSFLGLMMAFSVILVALGSVIEMSTLFFLAMASFCTGIAIAEFGTPLGAAFFAGSALLSLIISPNKLHALTYVGMAFYLLLTELVRINLLKAKVCKRNHIILIVVKFLTFNTMYIPILLFAPSLVLTKDINQYLLIGLVIAGQVVLIIYDKAFQLFIGRYWLDLKRRLKI